MYIVGGIKQWLPLLLLILEERKDMLAYSELFSNYKPIVNWILLWLFDRHLLLKGKYFM